MSSTFGNFLRLLRERRQMKQEELARATGVSQHAISDIEQNRRRSVLDVLWICKAADKLRIKRVVLFRRLIEDYGMLLLPVRSTEQKQLARELGSIYPELTPAELNELRAGLRKIRLTRKSSDHRFRDSA